MSALPARPGQKAAGLPHPTSAVSPGSTPTSSRLPATAMYIPAPGSFAALGGAGVLEAEAVPAAAAMFRGTGTITPNGSGVGSAEFSGTGDAFTFARIYGGAEFTADGEFTVTATPTATADFSGSGDIIAWGLPYATADLAGDAVLTATATVDATAMFAGDGVLDVPTNKTGGTFTGTGALSAAGAGAGTAGLTGAGSLTATAAARATATFTGAGSASASGAGVGTAGFTGAGTLTAAGRAYPVRVATNGNTFGVSANGATSYTINYPSGSTSGDLLVMQVQISRSSATPAYTPTVPSGGGTWTWFLAKDDSTVSGTYFAYFYCIRGSETSVTVGSTVTSSLRPFVVSIQAYKAGTFDPVLPVGDAAATFAIGPATSALTSPSVDPTVGNSEVLSFSGWALTGNSTTVATTWTSPATEVADFRQYVSAANITWNHSIAFEDRSSAGGSPTYTATPSTSTYQKCVASIVINPVGTTTLVTQDDFNRSAGSLGSNWNTLGGGTIAIDSNGYASGASVPSFPMSYAFSTTSAGSPNQIVEATVRWNGMDPAHSCAGIALRADTSLYPAAGATGAIFWFVRDLMGIMYEDQSDPNGFVWATGTSQYNATTKLPEGARIRLIARGTKYTATVNGLLWLSGTFDSATIPTTRTGIGIMIQNDSLVTSPTPGGDPPACLDDFKAYTF